MFKAIGRRLEDIVAGRTRTDVMAAIWNTAPFLNAVFNIDLKQYYTNAHIKLKVQQDFQRLFPDFICFPGIWADYGALCEPSAFGCPIIWPNESAPMALPAVSSLSEAVALRPPNPKKEGFMPAALGEYQYFHENADRDIMDEYGYLNGVAASFGPVELAAVIMGHENFFVSLVSQPVQVHELLKVTTESVIVWLKAQEGVNGTLKRFSLADHLPGQISPTLFDEFWAPYTKEVLDQFPEAMVLYHNEYPISYVHKLVELGFDIFNFGGPLAPVKQALGNSVTLMGNIDPIEVLLGGEPEAVKSEAVECLQEGAAEGRFLLSAAGGLAPNTPIDNLKAMAEALQIYSGNKKTGKLSNH